MGKTLPLGVSGVTDKQTGALLAAFASAGTDDPVLAVFGFAIVRSTGMTTSDSTLEAAKRGEASGKLLKMLVQAAQTTQNTAMQAAFNAFMTGTAAAMTWLSGGRSNFPGMPASYANLFKIQEDIQIVEFTRFAAQSAAGSDMGAQQVLEKNFSTKMTTIAGNIGGTTNGTTAVSAAVKSALTRLMQSPQI